MRRVFRTKPFSRWLRKTSISDSQLCVAVGEMVAGLVDANLGGHVFKKRVASPGRGKRGSLRVLIGTNLGDRWFFLYGFDKNERANIDNRELRALQKTASALLQLDSSQLSTELELDTLTEICHETQPHPQ